MSISQRIIENACIASNVWETSSEKIKKYFHLRPTQSGVTIYTTNPIMAMRGVDVKNKNRDLAAKLQKKVNDISKSYDRLLSDDIYKAVEEYKKLGFKEREKKMSGRLEEYYQAVMINEMGDDVNLQNKLRLKAPIRFVGSEIILEKGKHRIDIVGFEEIEKKLYLLELKKDRTEKVEQVANYVDYYSEGEASVVFKDLLKVYPGVSSVQFKVIRGVMVMRIAENMTEEKWFQKAAQHNVDILFFKESIKFEKVFS